MSTPLRSQIKNQLVTMLGTVTFPVAVNGSSTWASSVSRRLKMFANIDPSVQPAAFVVQHREGYTARGTGLPPRRWLEIGFWCFFPTPEGIIGDDCLDSIEEGIEAVFNVSDGIEQTLGGLCYSVKIDRQDGLFIRDPGDIDGQGLLVLPVRCLLP